ncbi:hypothetical protein RRF57_007821 [Xylaria bambusicola]|uniref:Uncharacterized protein n=1 Tax=Xylaria bambusicola TaxID=326684 RepID=A0AAN7Z7S8_9PEZI
MVWPWPRAVMWKSPWTLFRSKEPKIRQLSERTPRLRRGVLAQRAFLRPMATISIGAAVAVVAELVDALAVDPVRPHGWVFLKPRGSEDAVSGSILDVHVEILAGHSHDNVEVDLHAVSYTLLYAKGMVLLTLPPPR